MKKIINSTIEIFKCECGCEFESDEFKKADMVNIDGDYGYVDICPRCGGEVFIFLSSLKGV